MASSPAPSGSQLADDITVVIPTLGRDCLRRSVTAIAEGARRPAEIILSHQGIRGSMDAMLSEFAAKGYPVRYQHTATRGVAAGRNAGIAGVKTRFLATTDDDCIADVRWLEQMRAVLLAKPHEIATGRVLAEAEGAPSVSESDQPRLFTAVPLKGDHFCGGNFGAELAAFKKIGPFDETDLVRYCDDSEWAHRAFKAGFAIHYWPQIQVTHLHWRNDTEMATVYTNYALSQGGWFGRELRRGDLFFIVRIGFEMLRGAKRWIMGTVQGNYVRRVNGRAYVVDLARGILAGFKTRAPSLR